MDPYSVEYLVGDHTGFSFANSARNARLEPRLNDVSDPLHYPHAVKTGTTIVGIVCRDAVVLAADTRATTGPIVADKNCEKIHYIAPNMRCCGAGTAADADYVTNEISSKLALLRMAEGRQSRVKTAVRMLRKRLFPYQGHVGAALILGGCDVEGPQLYMIYPHGSSDRLPFAAMGSGSLAAIGILECGYHENMDTEEGAELAKKAITAGVMNDMGSGGHVDVSIIPRVGEVERRRNVLLPKGAERAYRKEGGYPFAKGTTVVVSEKIQPLEDTRCTIADYDPLLRQDGDANASADGAEEDEDIMA